MGDILFQLLADRVLIAAEAALEPGILEDRQLFLDRSDLSDRFSVRFVPGRFDQAVQSPFEADEPGQERVEVGVLVFQPLDLPLQRLEHRCGMVAGVGVPLPVLGGDEIGEVSPERRESLPDLLFPAAEQIPFADRFGELAQPLFEFLLFRFSLFDQLFNDSFHPSLIRVRPDLFPSGSS